MQKFFQSNISKKYELKKGMFFTLNLIMNIMVIMNIIENNNLKIYKK